MSITTNSKLEESEKQQHRSLLLTVCVCVCVCVCVSNELAQRYYYFFIVSSLLHGNIFVVHIAMDRRRQKIIIRTRPNEEEETRARSETYAETFWIKRLRAIKSKIYRLILLF
jgi:hypothetical protein